MDTIATIAAVAVPMALYTWGLVTLTDSRTDRKCSIVFKGLHDQLSYRIKDALARPASSRPTPAPTPPPENSVRPAKVEPPAEKSIAPCDDRGPGMKNGARYPQPCVKIDPKTGKVLARYRSLSQAAQATHEDCTASQLSLCCRGFRDAVHGFRWEYDVAARKWPRKAHLTYGPTMAGDK